ncbi:MBL fold metallo-hydrolase [Methylovirgula sp. 4M-Z18]|nr:MBL fold metallo-hydrolase [Methylovirgula sp. 4M-Z18]
MSNPYYSGPVTDHFDGIRFFTPGQRIRLLRKRELLKWRLNRRKNPWPREAPAAVDRPPRCVEGGALRVSYIGHASVLVQTQELNLLFDPVWSERASPFRFAGPKRVNAPGIAMEDLPPLDAIFVSHNHYDHMDVATLQALRARHPAARIITGLGNDVILHRRDAAVRAEAHDWGTILPLSDDVRVHLAPSYHWSARWFNDRRMALWAAFVIETPAGAIYYIGDTAYHDGALFREIGARFGDLRLAILPIGAYEPRVLMRDLHVNPAEAVRIFQDCGARFALAHHWGTFPLTDEAIDTPPRDLQRALAAAGLAKELFQVRRPGGVFDVPE